MCFLDRSTCNTGLEEASLLDLDEEMAAAVNEALMMTAAAVS